MGAHIFAIRPIDDGDVGTLSVDIGIEGIRSVFDRFYNILPWPFPATAAEVRNPLVGIIARLLVDALHLYVGHWPVPYPAMSGRKSDAYVWLYLTTFVRQVIPPALQDLTQRLGVEYSFLQYQPELNENNMAFSAQRLKELRLRQRESLQDVADAVSASKAHVWELETGRSKNPSMALLTKLAEHFAVPVANLIGEDPNTSDEEHELIAMFRDLKNLGPRDREILRSTITSMRKLKEQSE